MSVLSKVVSITYTCMCIIKPLSPAHLRVCKLGSCVSALVGAKEVEIMLHEPYNEHKGSNS